jgi:nitrogen-specific signal transduction histidine kinase
VSTSSPLFVEVRFQLVLDYDTSPPTYQDPEYLQEVLQEAIKDAVYDLGAEEVNEFFIELETDI